MTTAAILKRQKKFFEAGKTRSESFRTKTLQALRRGIREMEPEILEALGADLGKSRTEGYMAEIGMVLEELSYMEKHLHRLMQRKKAATPLAQFAASSAVWPEPYGSVLVMSPWNYPFLLSVDPVIGAVAAGNTVLLKPSAYSPAVSAVLQKLFARYVTPGAVSVVTGGREVNADLLEHRFDYIFFTGGREVGQMVMERASRHLTPVTLELGGKSPCIVDKTADLKLAARRIVFGKFLNAGQTCVAPDYILVQEGVKKKLVRYLKQEIIRQFGEEPLRNPHYGHIVNQKHFDRLWRLVENQVVLTAGGLNRAKNPWIFKQPEIFQPKQLRIAPRSRCMQEEIFGPILPILTWEKEQDLIKFVESRPHPLALYLFSERREWRQKMMRRLRFGGGCINDTVIHLASSRLPFGGVGESGMGSYHGKQSFDTFTHYKSVVDKKTWLDLPIRYQPYTKEKEMLIRMFMGS